MNADLSGCWDKIPGCSIPLNNQTFELWNDEHWGEELWWDNNKYACPMCLPGFYWDIEDEGQGSCETCASAMPHCAECESEDKCTVCRTGLTMLGNGAGCETPNLDCDSPPEEYILLDDGTFGCPICKPGFFSDSDGQCVSCGDEFTALCTECNADGCLACNSELELFPTPDGQDCQEVAACQDEEEDFIMVYDEVLDMDVYGCGTCSNGFVYDEWTNQCTPCNVMLPFCDVCDGTTCITCAPGTWMTEDREHCVPNIPNCKSHPSEYVMRTHAGGESFDCPVCEDGFYFVDYSDEDPWGCIEKCDETIPYCNTCEFEFEENEKELFCTSCHSGYMLEFGNQWCSPYIDHCTVDLDDQPDDLEDTAVDRNGHEKYTCKCEPGFNWNSWNWMCESCVISYCNECAWDYDLKEGHIQKCDECASPAFSTPDTLGCQMPIVNCKEHRSWDHLSSLEQANWTLPNYERPEKWNCHECIEGMYWNEKEWKCREVSDHIAHCLASEDLMKCDLCKPGYTKATNGQCAVIVEIGGPINCDRID